MKKFLILPFLLFLPLAVSAQTCTYDNQQTVCASGVCNITSGQEGTCQPPDTTQPSQSSAQSQTTSAPGSTQTTQSYVPIAPIPGLTQGVTTNNIPNFLNHLYEYLIGLAAIIAIIQIIRGGFDIATSSSIGAHSEGRTLITQAIFGLILILSPVIVFSIINPSILNLSYNLPAIQLNPLGTQSLGGGGLGSAQPTAPPTTGNPVVVHGAVVDKQFSVTSQEAADYVSSCKTQGGYGYFANGVIGNLPLVGDSGGKCTASQTTQNVNGSSVSTKTTCTNYQYTAFCSQNPTFTAVDALPDGSDLHGNSKFAHGTAFPYGNGVQFVNGCLNQDKGYVVATQVTRTPSCPTDITTQLQQNGMSSGFCFQELAWCKIVGS